MIFGKSRSFIDVLEGKEDENLIEVAAKVVEKSGISQFKSWEETLKLMRFKNSTKGSLKSLKIKGNS